MNNAAFEILLLMAGLAQLKDSQRVVSLYIESLNSLFPGYEFRWVELGEVCEGCIEVCTRNHRFGFVAVAGATPVDPAGLALVHNSGQMLAVVLEKLGQEQILVEQNKTFEAIATERTMWAEQLEIRIRERTADLEAANLSLAASRAKLEQLNAGLEQRVQERTAEIERSRAAMEAFSYTVSHDLRAPLRAIDGFTQILLEDHLAELSIEAQGILNRVVGGASRMGRLIEALLGLSGLERHELILEAVDCEQVVDEIRQDLLASGARSEATVWQIARLPKVQADPELVRRIFANLLGNAWKFSRARDVACIRIGAQSRCDGTWYQVSDNGVGFDMAYANQLFEVFHRLHDDSVEGVGIGLATVKKCLDQMGGAIEFESHPEQGANFCFRLTPPLTDSLRA